MYYLKPLEQYGDVLTACASLCNKLLETLSGYKAGTLGSFPYSTEPLGTSLLTPSAALQPLYKLSMAGKMDQQIRLLIKDPSSLSGTMKEVQRVPTVKSCPLIPTQMSWHVCACIL